MRRAGPVSSPARGGLVDRAAAPRDGLWPSSSSPSRAGGCVSSYPIFLSNPDNRRLCRPCRRTGRKDGARFQHRVHVPHGRQSQCASPHRRSSGAACTRVSAIRGCEAGGSPRTPHALPATSPTTGRLWRGARLRCSTAWRGGLAGPRLGSGPVPLGRPHRGRPPLCRRGPRLLRARLRRLILSLRRRCRGRAWRNGRRASLRSWWANARESSILSARTGDLDARE